MNSGIPYDQFNLVGQEYIKIFDLSLNSDQKQKFEILKKQIRDSENDKSVSAKKKGEIFEKLIELILESTQVFRYVKNEHTTSNEIDFVVTLNLNGRILRDSKIIPEWIPDTFLIECKNYKDPVEVGLIGKFYSLMIVSNINLGFFISNCHVTGRDKRYWKDAAAFINKINLKYSESAKPFYLIDITLEQLENLLKDDYNIIELIMDRKTQITTDINYSINDNISNHEREGNLKME